MNHLLFQQLAHSRVLFLDGATGTELVKQGMPPGVSPELWVLDHPEAILAVQDGYRAAGSNIVYAPTFGANRFKLAEFHAENNVRSINEQLARIAKSKAKNSLVFGDVAPTGKFLAPFGELDFDQAVDAYKEQIEGLVAGGVDGIAIETIFDLQEARAALIAARECAPDLAVIVTMTFEPTGKTLTGNDPAACLVTLQALGADAFGCNCSAGPDAMAQTIAAMRPYAQIPLIAKPNAGMPCFRDGKTVFEMSPEQFGALAPGLLDAGATILGGCCGTTAEHIKAAKLAVDGRIPEIRPPRHQSAIASASRVLAIEQKSELYIIGERINPTGKKLLRAELKAGSLDLVADFARQQTEAGAHLLDVNVGMPGIDEQELLPKTVARVVQVSPLPLSIDSTDPEAVEKALRLYPGRALLNSISGEKKRLENVLPIAAKYGAMLILLPLTDDGIPSGTTGRFDVIEEIRQKAAIYGYQDQDFVIDALIMTISAEPTAADQALDFIRKCRDEHHLATVCGLSNISFGLPRRELVNRAFLSLAINAGLTMAIANPADEELMCLALGSCALAGRDEKFGRFLKAFTTNASTPSTGHSQPSSTDAPPSPEQSAYHAVLIGDDDKILGFVERALQNGVPASILLEKTLVPAIEEVGGKFERHEYYLPQLIASARAMEKAVDHLAPLLAAGGKRTPIGKILLATVKGDIHDIGKNIVSIMLKNSNFEVVDLGKDVSAETILAEADQRGIGIIGLSALMTTTLPAMEEVVALAKKQNKQYFFIVGGAVVDEDFADKLGAHYASDAPATVRLAKEYYQK
ncbi:MAG: homocysteine S-methyltransferase family protein [Victivallaceae bacterium]|nr:homocysteine S-methyltransferase family protein [Victivallaceae bacterium]